MSTTKVTQSSPALRLSSNRSSLSTDKALAAKYVQALSELEGVTAVNVGGSRSPKSAKTERSDSDWDFHVITANAQLLPQPLQWGLHGEAHCFPSDRKKDVQVWPSDEYGLLK